MKVLVIPEDQRLDRYIVQPVIAALFGELEIPARIDVLPEPQLRGANDALDQELLAEIITANPMIDLFLLVVDEDCNRGNHVERAAARESEHAGRLLACLAHQEVEVWMLWLHRASLGVQFSEVRRECDPKERWAESLLKSLGRNGPGNGRKLAMRSLGSGWRGLSQACTEIADLRERVRRWHAVRRASP